MKEALEDKELLELLHLDKEGGFRVLMHQYQERIYWHIRRMVTYHEDADDVVQNTFIKVYRNIGGFKGDSKIYTWLFRIATNESLTFLKRKKRDSIVESGTDENPILDNLRADVYFNGNDAELALQRAILVLPDKQKAVFNLRYYDQMSYKDMSDMLGTSVGALKASYHLAVKKIEHFITNKDQIS